MITIRKKTDTVAVRAWLDAANPVMFRINADATFTFGAEGVALGAIKELSRRGLRLSVSFAVARAQLESKQISALIGCFGLYLLTLATDATTSDGLDVRVELLERIWRHHRDGGGATPISLGGTKFSLVFRDPDLVSPPIVASAEPDEFPPRSSISDLIGGVLDSMGSSGARDLVGSPEITNFVYEALRNTHDHGRFGMGDATSYRGLICEKLIFASIQALKDAAESYPGPLGSYLTDYCSVPRHRGAQAFFGLTVADVGPGIQNTLDPSHGEKADERFQQAFKWGVSRMPAATETSVGEGLPRILGAVKKLRGLLLVSSGEIFAHFNGALGTPRLTKGMPINKTGGTSLTLIVPFNVPRAPDQHQ